MWFYIIFGMIYIGLGLAVFLSLRAAVNYLGEHNIPLNPSEAPALPLPDTLGIKERQFGFFSD